MRTERVLRLGWAVLLGLGLSSPCVAESRLTGDLPRRAELGFRLRTANGGLVVREVTPASPAARAGLQVNDKLLAIAGRAVGQPDAARDSLRRLKGGVLARLTVERGGKPLEIAFTPAPLPLEHLEGVDTVYGDVAMPDGARLRTVITRPAGVSGKLPAIFLTQWVSCDGVEPLGDDAWNQVLRALVTRSKVAFIRVDRSSGGDSEGPACDALDYDTEVAHYRAALERLRHAEGIDPERIVVFGMSLGSTTAPLVARGQRVAGVIASGGGAHTYYERMLAFDRIGFELGGARPEEIDALLRRSAEFHAEYLLRGRTPDAVAAERPHLAGHWARLRGTSAGNHYGRPFAWHQQAARHDFAAAWSELDAPVLVVYGEYDQFEPPAAHRAIAEAVERTHPGRARVVEVPRMNHFYRVFADRKSAAEDEPGLDAPELAAGPMLDWLRDVLGTK